MTPVVVGDKYCGAPRNVGSPWYAGNIIARQPQWLDRRTSVPGLDVSRFEVGLREVLRSPADDGTVELIVRRPAEDEREVLVEAYLDPAAGLLGDGWLARKTAPTRQVAVMNARVAAMLAGSRSRWPLAGDQLFVDLDLSAVNLPPGSRLAVGTAVLEVSDDPHRGCKKFADRFGVEALRLVNSQLGDELRLRGINARVVRAGLVRTGDPIRRHLAHDGYGARRVA